LSTQLRQAAGRDYYRHGAWKQIRAVAIPRAARPIVPAPRCRSWQPKAQMCEIAVEPESLAELGAKLATAASVAGEIQHFWSAAGLMLSVSESGDEHMSCAIAEFVMRWGYGCGFLHADATSLAALLSRAGSVYLDVESAIAGATR
jgi:hypothetical protein